MAIPASDFSSSHSYFLHFEECFQPLRNNDSPHVLPQPGFSHGF